MPTKRFEIKIFNIQNRNTSLIIAGINLTIVILIKTKQSQKRNIHRKGIQMDYKEEEIPEIKSQYKTCLLSSPLWIEWNFDFIHQSTATLKLLHDYAHHLVMAPVYMFAN